MANYGDYIKRINVYNASDIHKHTMNYREAKHQSYWDRCMFETSETDNKQSPFVVLSYQRAEGQQKWKMSWTVPSTLKANYKRML